MPKDETKLNLIPNLLNTLADIIEEVADAADFWNSVKISTFVSLARNSAENFDVETTLSSDELEQDFANLMEGGTFSMDLSFDRSKFYVEFADEWTGHIKKIFAAETFAGVIKAVSDKKDEADLIFQMSKKQPVPKEEASDAEEARDYRDNNTILGDHGEVMINIVVPDTEESLKMNLEQHEAQKEEAPEEVANEAPSEAPGAFPGKEPTRNNFFGPSKKDELPGQRTFPADPEDAKREG